MAATSAFTDQVLSERLSKLNNSQQSIETLSHWCIFHRKRAKQVVQTWQKDFLAAPNERKISFLYLANDILQNSRKKGNEFVSEFYKVLPAVLGHGINKGGDKMMDTVTRLLDIWSQRKVFGTKDLKEFMQAGGGSTKTEQPAVAPYKPLGFVDKVAAELKAVEDAGTEEEEILQKCNEAITEIQLLEKPSSSIGAVEMSARMRQRQATLAWCMDRMEKSETRRSQLVASLKEVLSKQEVQLERVRTQLQIAQAHAEQEVVFTQAPSPPVATSAPPPQKDLLLSTPKGPRPVLGPPPGADLANPPRVPSFKDQQQQRQQQQQQQQHQQEASPPLHEPINLPVSPVSDTDMPSTVAASTPPQEPQGSSAPGSASTAPQPIEAAIPDKSVAVTAAEMAAKLAASSSSVSMLSSVLSKLVAESGKASLNSGGSAPALAPPGAASADLEGPKEKRRKLSSLDEVVSSSLTGFEPSYISPPPPGRRPPQGMLGMSNSMGRGGASLGILTPQPQGMNMLPLGWPPGAPPPAYAPYQPGPPPLGYYNQPPSSSMQ